MQLDLDRVRVNARAATDEDLLDRVTVYRAGMEPEALEVIEEELRERGLTDDDVETHAERRRAEVRVHADGTAVPCSFCHRPAIGEGWGWHWLNFGPPRVALFRVPLFPRYYYYCEEHWPERPRDGD